MTYEMALEARKQEKTCDPVFKNLIEDMIKQNSLDNQKSALVVINSFDCDKDDIEDVMTQ
jgi:hypothetical protein